MFFYNFNTDTGLDWATTNIEYQGYSFRNGMLILLANVIGWTAVGLYLDQVVPSQYGVAKPLCFCCQRRRRRRNDVGDEERAALLAKDDIADKDPNNFE